MTPAGTPILPSQTSSGNQTMTAPGGTLPSQVDEEDGPPSVAISTDDDRGLYQ